MTMIVGGIESNSIINLQRSVSIPIAVGQCTIRRSHLKLQRSFSVLATPSEDHIIMGMMWNLIALLKLFFDTFKSVMV